MHTHSLFYDNTCVHNPVNMEILYSLRLFLTISIGKGTLISNKILSITLQPSDFFISLLFFLLLDKRFINELNTEFVVFTVVTVLVFVLDAEDESDENRF